VPLRQRTERRLQQRQAPWAIQLEELEAAATEDELAAKKTAAPTMTVAAHERKRPSRQPFPAHLPRERVVIPGPASCACCGSTRLSKLGEDVTETLEVIPRQWKVIQTVREKFGCRDCESIGQAPAPFHVTPRGWAGPNLLAMILFEKFGQHQPLNRQAERYAREAVDLSLSTLADQVGACCAVLKPLFKRLEREGDWRDAKIRSGHIQPQRRGSRSEPKPGKRNALVCNLDLTAADVDLGCRAANPLT
jgi:transposase